MKALSVSSHACVCVCVASLCVRSRALGPFFGSADVALTASDAPETVQLHHTGPHLGRVW